MPKPESREQEEADLAARWLQLADAALSATEKAAKALEIAREEQEHIRRDIKRKLANYSKLKQRRTKRVRLKACNTGGYRLLKLNNLDPI